MSGRKMSKSAGNFQRITELVDEGLDPLAFRYLCLTARYAKKLNLSAASLAGAAGGLASLRAELAALGPAPAVGPWAPGPRLRAGAAPDRPVGRADGVAGHQRGFPSGEAPEESEPRFELRDRAAQPRAPLSPTGRAFHDRFVAAIDDDLDTPGALRVLRQTLRSSLPPDERRWLALEMDLVLGLDLDRGIAGRDEAGTAATPVESNRGKLSSAVRALIDQRTVARSARDFATADRLRLELRELGVEVVDDADGRSRVRVTPRG
jgi:cysteinyl-tRNA synthetase